MTSTLKTFIAGLLFGTVLVSCNSDTLYDLGDNSYRLLNADSTIVEFPSDFKGEIAVISFIYTHCPDVCSIITANMKNIQNELQDTSGVQFIEISFDPMRDSPAVLQHYKELFGLNEQFTMLTGDTSEVRSLLNELEIVAEKTEIDTLQQNNEYFMKHSNTIYLMDEEGRIRAEYPASFVPPENVVEDLKKLR